MPGSSCGRSVADPLLDCERCVNRAASTLPENDNRVLDGRRCPSSTRVAGEGSSAAPGTYPRGSFARRCRCRRNDTSVSVSDGRLTATGEQDGAAKEQQDAAEHG